MNEAQHGINLLQAIIYDDFSTLSYLLDKSQVGVNKQTNDGDTPLLVCLKLMRSVNFIKKLLSASANITIANKRRETPLSFSVAFCDVSVTELLLKRAVDTQFQYQTTLSRRIRRDLQNNNCAFKMYVIPREFDTEIVLVSIMSMICPCNYHVDLNELSVLLDHIEADLVLQKCVGIYTHLFLLSIDLKTATAFKILWSRTSHMDITDIEQTLLYYYIESCEYNNLEYVECLRLILVSQQASCLINQHICDFTETIYQLLLHEFAIRRICKRHKILVISDILQLQNVTIQDFMCAYHYFGFREEAVILLQHLQPSELVPENCSPPVVEFIVDLENDPMLKTDNLCNLNFIVRLNYRKLVNSLPEEAFPDSKVIKSKKQILNTVPTLSEMSRYAFQKSVEKFYNVEDLNQFTQVVENIGIPKLLKKDLCENPPLACN